MKPEALQKLMRHKNYQTTLGYVNLSSQLDDAIKTMPVPDALKQDKRLSEDPKGQEKDDGENQPTSEPPA